MRGPDRETRQDWAEGGPERLYVVTAGHGRPSGQVPCDLVTLIVSRGSPKPGMHPEQAAILRLCAAPLSIAEISAYLALPTSMVILLVEGLVDSGKVEVRAPMSAEHRPEIALLEAVINGLSQL